MEHRSSPIQSPRNPRTDESQEGKNSMRYSSKKISLVATLGFALVALGPAQAAEKHLTVLMSIPDLAFPFFVHMVDQAKDEGNKLGDIDLIIGDGQRSSPKQTADVEAGISKGVNWQNSAESPRGINCGRPQGNQKAKTSDVS